MDPSKSLGSGPGLTIRQPLAMNFLSIMQSNFYLPWRRFFKAEMLDLFWGKFVLPSLPFVQGGGCHNGFVRP